MTSSIFSFQIKASWMLNAAICSITNQNYELLFVKTNVNIKYQYLQPKEKSIRASYGFVYTTILKNTEQSRYTSNNAAINTLTLLK